VGLQQGNFSYATAIGLFNGVVSFILIIIANRSAKKLSSSSLW
jgi:putative aldouronate transport system permease protein